MCRLQLKTQGITDRPPIDEVINKPSIVTNDTRLEISYYLGNDLAGSEKEFDVASVYRIESGRRNVENAEPASPATPLLNIIQL
jgi:hypothetical protein